MQLLAQTLSALPSDQLARLLDVAPTSEGSILGLGQEAMLAEEYKKVNQVLKKSDYIVLLDEGGKEFSSLKFSEWMNKKFVSVNSDLVFIVGGAFGFHPELKERASESISLSKMTFTHQMARLFFTEQLYRAMTILKNEPYHHQ